MNAPQTDWLGTIRQTFTKAVVYLLCLLTAMPAWSASTLYQSPPFTSTEPPANVFMMLDDSGSMSGHSLPIPAAITISATALTSVAIQGDGADSTGVWALRSWTINRDNDWLLRAPALNPLWYNPANRYVPWNKDGTLMPNASIGGSVATTHYGAFTSRANAAELTERDPRHVPVGNSFVSITNAAGRGLLGTDSNTQRDAVNPLSIAQGRRVTQGQFADFRYNKMPFDFGPILAGSTSAPRNGHADRNWTTHNDTTSPLDLFSRPLQPTNSTQVTGCFKDAASCLAGDKALAPLVTSTWKQTDCNGTVQTYTSKPADLTCWKRTECNGQVKVYSSKPDDQICGYSWIDCAGVAQNNKPNPPATTSCPKRIQNCDGTWTNDPQVNSLTCYATRTACGNGGFGAWSSTQTTPADCWSQATCTGSTQYSSGSRPADVQCKYALQNCDGTSSQYDASPASLKCYQQTNCAGQTTISASKPDPETLACGYSRKNCGASVATTYTMQQGNPGTLTCYWRQNCNGTNTGWASTVLQTLTCPSATEPQPTYFVSTMDNASTPITKGTTELKYDPTGGSLLKPVPVAMTKQEVRSAYPASTITVNPTTAKAVKDDRGSTQVDAASCPANTGDQTCTIPALPGVPDPLALTPARYYRYIGTGDKGLPANYRVVQIDRTRPSSYVYPVIDATTGAVASTTTSQRSDCAAITSCTWLEEAQNYANWYLYYRNRLFAAQAVVADSLSSMTTTSQQKLRLGYGRINYYSGAFNPWTTQQMQTISALPAIDGETNPGALVRGVRPFVVGTQDRQDFFNWLFSLAWVGSTPNREAIDSVGRYFSRTDNKGPWGATPGINDTSPQLGCRRNSLFLTTDGEWTNSAAGQPLIGDTGPLQGNGGPQESDNVAGPTITGDGANAGATFTYQPSAWRQFTGGTSQAQTLTDAAVYYWNHDLRPDLPNVILPVTEGSRPNPAFWQSMSTYIIGYGLSASMDTAATRTGVTNGTTVTWPTVDLTSTLSTGGNRVNDSLRAALASRGNFYAAQTVAELKSGMLGSFLEIATRQGSAGGVAVTGPAITSSSQAYFPSYVTGKWTGSLKAYLSSDLESLAQGNSVAPQWTSSLPAFGARNIFSSTALNVSTNFDVASLNSAQATSLTSTTPGLSYTAAEAVNYLRGDQSLELPATGISAGTKFRRRESVLGDIVNSTPLYVKAPDYGYGAMSSVGSSYASYVTARRSGTASTVYVGANDGMFHAFDAATGIERFAYVPRGVYPTLANLLNPGYEHNYYVDGPVTAGDWHDGTAWRSMVIGTTGAGGANGGSSVFAIDITSQASITSSNVKWDTTPADVQSASHLGHILNRGIVGRIKTASGTQWVYMVGNGYESTSNKAALLVFDIATGAMTPIPVGPTWTIGNGDNARNGMGGITVVYDSERNIKLVYGGDRQGNLWRFDFSSGTPAGAKGFDNASTPLFTTPSVATTTPVVATVRRPISAAPRLVPHPLGGMLVIFGTGKLYDTTDSLDTTSQGIYAIWDKPQYTGATIPSAQIKPLTVTGAAGSTRTIDTAVNWNSFMGWSAELTGGERIISDPTADVGSLTVTSYAPSAALDPCNGGGVSYIYRFNFATGVITGSQVNGVVGAVTPLTIAPTSTSRTADAGVNISSGIGRTASSTGGFTFVPMNSTSQCRLYSTSIQGRPNVIAVNCPNFAPMRVWRQQVR
jgi:type IV pilus assembly protein PilY1